MKDAELGTPVLHNHPLTQLNMPVASLQGNDGRTDGYVFGDGGGSGGARVRWPPTRTTRRRAEEGTRERGKDETAVAAQRL